MHRSESRSPQLTMASPALSPLSNPYSKEAASHPVSLQRAISSAHSVPDSNPGTVKQTLCESPSIGGDTRVAPHVPVGAFGALEELLVPGASEASHLLSARSALLKAAAWAPGDAFAP